MINNSETRYMLAEAASISVNELLSNIEYFGEGENLEYSVEHRLKSLMKREIRRIRIKKIFK